MSQSEIRTNREELPAEDENLAADPSTVAEESSAPAAEEDVYEPPTREEFEALREKAAKADVYLNEVLKAKADLENYQKRMQRERPNWENSIVRGFARDLLPVLDNFERAIHARPEAGGESEGAGSAVLEGIRMIHQMFLSTLRDHDVEPIEAEGRPFDPNVHEAVGEIPSAEHETGAIVEVLQKGYAHRDVVVRPSKVLLARRVVEDGETTDSPATE